MSFHIIKNDSGMAGTRYYARRDSGVGPGGTPPETGAHFTKLGAWIAGALGRFHSVPGSQNKEPRNG